MMRQFVQITLLTGTLLVGLVPLAMARKDVVATVTAVDTKTNMATLQTTGGEVFHLPKEERWQVGSTVECERVADAVKPMFIHCATQ
jgi:hypothetical protein